MLSNEELLQIKGGTIAANFLNSVSRLIEGIYKIGYNLGSTIRRVVSGTVCKIS